MEIAVKKAIKKAIDQGLITEEGELL